MKNFQSSNLIIQAIGQPNIKKVLFPFLFLAFICQAKAQTKIVLQPNALQGKDATVFSINPNSNAVNRESNTAYTWTYQGNLAVKRFFLEFDLSSIPANAVITDARLSLFYNPTDPYESFDFHSGVNVATIQRVTSSWQENTITWNNQPAVSTINQVGLPQSTSPTQNYTNVDVTNLVIDMHNPSNGNHGFRISLNDEVNFYKSLLFASSDHPRDDLHPKLEITYTTTNCTLLKPNALQGKDATVFSINPNSNGVNRESNTAYTWTYQGNLAVKRFFLEFDLTSIPANATITSAELSLFYNPTDPYESFDFHSGANAATIQRVTSSWQENTITWNNQPPVSTNNQVGLTQSTSPSQDYINTDVTNLVRDMHKPSNGNHGFRISLNDEVNYYISLLFASSDHPDSTLHPELKVCWFANNSTSVEKDIDEGESFTFEVFPNPSEGLFEINIKDGDLTTTDVEVYDLLGKKVSNFSIVNSNQINIHEKGIYFIRLSGKDKKRIITKKVIIQ